jgi:hypothetical protein
MLLPYLRKHAYRWHRITGMIIALPILMWTVSGFLHPVMSTFKPRVNNSFVASAPIDSSRICIGLKEALQRNHINRLQQFRIVEWNSQYYYQVRQPDADTLCYISCFDGSMRKHGDRLYAAYLAEKMLNDPPSKEQQGLGHPHAAQIATVFTNNMSSTEKASVSRVELVSSFTDEYRRSNVLLPVYRVSFDRADGIRLYVETSTGRLATAVDNRKAWFTRFFAAAHSWSFLDGMGNAKNILMGSIAALCFLSSLSGFYIYNFSKKKKPVKGTASRQRSYHRTLGNIFVFTTLLFAFSGAWHSFHKISGEENNAGIYDHSVFAPEQLDLPLGNILRGMPAFTKLTNVSIVSMNGKHYWQLFVKSGKHSWILYRDKENLNWLEDGDIQYGCYLACRFAGKTQGMVSGSHFIKGFTNRYNMMYKRLPVLEVAFARNDNYYVETSTGYLAAVTGKADQAERFSFSNLHMQHFWEDWLGNKAGKPVRNIVLTGSTLGLLLLAATGMAIYIARRRKKLSRKTNA